MKISELPGDEDSGLTCRTYVFQNESHTLGNALNCIISRYEDVQLCGYTVPHPAESKMHFRIQTKETPALEILKRGLKDLEKVCDHTIDLFEKEVKEFHKTYPLFHYFTRGTSSTCHVIVTMFRHIEGPSKLIFRLQYNYMKLLAAHPDFPQVEY